MTMLIYDDGYIINPNTNANARRESNHNNLQESIHNRAESVLL